MKKDLVNEYKDIEKKKSELLVSREVVARFASREWGARSMATEQFLHPSFMESL